MFERHFKRISILAFSLLAAASLLIAQEPSLEIARQLTGYYEGVGPANHLKMTIQPGRPVVNVPNTYQFDVAILGKYEKTNVSLRGNLAVQREADGVRIAWKRDDGQGCDTHLRPEGDGFEGRTLEGACQSAFQNPVLGSWSFHTEPGSIVVREVRTGETLRFRRTVGGAKG